MNWLKILLFSLSALIAIGVLFLNKTIERPGLTTVIVILIIASIGIGIYLEKQDADEHNNEIKRANSAFKKIDELHAALINEHMQYMKEQFEIQQASGRLMPPYFGDSKEPYKLIFGTNTFINTPNVLIVDGIPLVTMKVKNNILLVSATIYDNKGQVLALMRDNEWIFERTARLKKEVRINSLKIWDENNNLLLDCKLLSNKRIKLNGIFRKDGAEIIATDEGLHVKSSGKTSVGLGGI